MPQTVDLFGDGPTPTDSAFRHILESSRPEPRKAGELVRSLWRKTEPYLEGGIPNRLRYEFHACFWEMYLTASLLDRNLPVTANSERRYQNGKGPDVQVGTVAAWIEAIVATAGTGPDAVPGYSFGQVALVPDEAFKLRLTAAISEKLGKYRRYLTNGIVTESEPFVIAVSGAAVPYVHQDVFPGRIIAALFPFGPEAVLFDRRTNTLGDSYFTYQADIKKKNGTSIPTTFFEQEDSRGISAVIYSVADAFNFPDVLGADLTLIHNPQAASPLPRGFLGVGHEWWQDGDNLVRRDHNSSGG